MNHHPAAKLALLLAVLTGFALESAAQQTIPAPVKKIESAVVTVIAYDAKGSVVQEGRGFFVNKEGMLVSNLHLLNGAAKIQIKTHDGKAFALKAVGAEDREADLFAGTTDVPAQTLSDLQITYSPPKVGDQAFVLGNPSGTDEAYLVCTVKAFKDIPGFGRSLQISAPIPPKLSGAPLVNAKGEIVGVAALQVVPGQTAYFALPPGKIRGLRQNRIQPTNQWSPGPAKPWLTTPAGLSYKGLNYLWVDDFAKALACFEEVLTKHPNKPEALFFVGYCNAKLEHWQQAADSFSRLVQIKPGNAPAYDQLGAAYAKLTRWDDAVAAYKQEVKLKPDNVFAQLNLGIAYGNLEKYDDEIEACKQAVQLKPDFYNAQYTLGLVYGKVGRWEDAVAAFKMAVQAAPRAAEAYDDLGVSYGELKRWNEAIDAYKHALAIRPNDTTAPYNMGVAYGNLGQHEDAIRAYNEAIRINPKDADAMDNMGIALGQLGHWDEAAEAFKEVVKLRPDDPEVRDNLGSAYYKMGKYKEAADAHREATRLKPDSAKSHYNLAIDYLALHDKPLAMQEYKTLKPLDADMAAKLFALMGK
jgi:tetratricopeptide (TPR) repeat protein